MCRASPIKHHVGLSCPVLANGEGVVIVSRDAYRRFLEKSQYTTMRYAGSWLPHRTWGRRTVYKRWSSNWQSLSSLCSHCAHSDRGLTTPFQFSGNVKMLPKNCSAKLHSCRYQGGRSVRLGWATRRVWLHLFSQKAWIAAGWHRIAAGWHRLPCHDCSDLQPRADRNSRWG